MSRIMMWMNYRRKYNVSVPSPFDGDHTIPWWYDKIASEAAHLASIGCTDILFPQPCKTNAGPYPGADGYGVYDDYDIGSKDTSQFGGTPTRFGYAAQLRRAIAICHANGMNVLIDHVMHQRMGGRGSVYRYSSATGKTNGRFPKDPTCFRKTEFNLNGVQVDQVPSPPDDYAFGDELCPINAIPKDYVKNGLIDASDWLFNTLDIDGARLDDMKGINIDFIKEWMTSKAMQGKWFFGEYASGNSNDTCWWVSQVNGLASAADFDAHYNIYQDICAGTSSFQMSWVTGRGMLRRMPLKAVPFVESMDSDTNGFATIVNNKMLAYAAMLCGEGLPCIYIRDYLQEPDCYGLKKYIDNLIWINSNLASGTTVTRHADSKVWIYERTGKPGLICCLNNDFFNPEWKFVNVQTNFGPSVQLHDYTGHNENDTWTDWQGRATLAIPPGANGMGYCCWSKAGVVQASKSSSRSTTQVFYGAADLDIGPAVDKMQVVENIWAAKNSKIKASIKVDKTNWTAESKLGWMIKNPNGVVLNGVVDVNADPTEVTAITQDEGWYEIMVGGEQLPTDGSPYEFEVTYLAPKTFNWTPTVASTQLHPVPKADLDLANKVHEMATGFRKWRIHRIVRQCNE